MGDWNKLASNNYEAANSLVENKFDRSSVSRAYYAAYSRVAAALVKSCVMMPAGREGPHHANLPDMVEVHLVEKLDQNRWLVSKNLRKLYALRLAADYRPSVSMTSGDSKKALLLMSQVLSENQRSNLMERSDDEIQVLQKHIQEMLDQHVSQVKNDFKLKIADHIQQEGWLYFVVEPDREGVRAYDYAEALTEVETKLRREEHVDHVFLVPALAA